MNKVLSFLLALCFSAPSTWAVARDEMEVQIIFQGQQGFASRHLIRITPQAIVLNGIAISSHVLPSLSAEMSLFLNPKNDRRGNCRAGEYIHHAKSNKFNRQASGCLGSPTAERLFSSLKKLEGLSFLRHQPTTTGK